MSEAAPEKLWGALAIAQATNLSCTAIRRLSKDPRVPIYKPIGSNRLFAFRSELMTWLRTKPEEK